ncbi:MAG: glycoside hydrolase family 3 C-terminal domain-containing protein, partial [Firmicutes bacterium]|nr:glycoside hydrolase family 3 C-terminal domain-containing protein [Bacillota bacterium]
MTKQTENNLTALLTTEEKISLQTGFGCWNTAPIEKLKVRSVTFADGPVGLRKMQDGKTLPAVAFPSVAKLSCSFDPDLLRSVGTAVGEQCRAEGVDVLLAPGINIKRDPRCGRNFEYFSEDPFLTAELANAYIAGVNSQNVGVCLKHFAANNYEYGRMVSDSVVDERALREIYLNAFERVIKKSEPCAVMCSYNKLNGEYCSQDKRLLTDILRGEWGFKGLTVSDWGATDDRAKGLNSGLDLEMPQGDVRKVASAVENSELDVSVLDGVCDRVIALSRKFDNSAPRGVDYDYQHEACRKISAECTVLVKNNCKLLPLKKTDEIAVIGALAETPVFQGGGSSKVNAYKTDNFLSALDGADIKYAYAQGYALDGEENENLVDEAVNTAQKYDKVILFVGDKADREERDRADYGLPKAQLRVIDAVTSANSNVVIVLQSGSSVDVSWSGAAKAMLIDYYGGEHSGRATFDVIFGDVCPSGRLAETWYSDLPDYLNGDCGYKRRLYKESIYVGYRYCVTADVPVAFPFGYGLSYNDIKWSS